ncbi:NAD(P)H-hydrate dehydratase [Ramlibacter humi]|uniref:Bifunctional NAD(P)H-hydrate repair enzyme n=1 Tax=Ramlibacter humi TaxID=2530451 RepID=A0A4Z0CAG3_9BURK|nr:NAD(P)H-hydrate dehydratase [Ramlibacter humi]TFZ08004.1 NAD(P)H-hydrate dehydratase [Ramlibacter humi]
MLKVTFDRPWPLHGTAATRRIEQEAAASLPAHALMERAGLAVARLALAIAPHAHRVWVACGPGNNGGDGLEAAVHLHRWGKAVTVTLAGSPDKLPPDAANAWRKCREAGVPVADALPSAWDLGIDALLGLGSSRPLEDALAAAAGRMSASASPVLAIDLPSGLNADTGNGQSVRAAHTVSLLTLKPGLFTGAGRDAAGELWFDDLGVQAAEAPTAQLAGPAPVRVRAHASHKGLNGDVAVIGGAPGMAGAAVLAATSALCGGAGRVFLAPLDTGFGAAVPGWPELMVRAWDALPLESISVACGCGGGDAVAAMLPAVLSRAKWLVLDADALNAIAADASLQETLRRRGRPTVLTPHPLEAARLLGTSTAQVQGDRLRAAQELGERSKAVVVLKGSGTVIAAPGTTPSINPTGNGRLATGGTGDVLAGLVAAALPVSSDALQAAAHAVYRHGKAADDWPAGEPLTAGALARRLHLD